MELRQLRYLVAIAEEGSFTRAAARETVAQPALSQQIAKLERELGVPLVERGRGGAELTEAGEIVVARGRHALAEIAAITSEVGELTGLLRGSLRIGLTLTPGPLDVARLIAGFHHRYPEVDVAMTEDLSTELVHRLTSGALDVAFVSGVPESARGSIELVPLAHEPLVGVVSRSHRLASRRRLRLKDLAEDAFVMFREGAIIREAVLAEAAATGFQPKLRFEAGEVSRVRALVAQGLAVSILPASDALAPGPPVSAIELTPRLQHEVSAAYRAGRRLSPAARAFLAHLDPGAPGVRPAGRPRG